MRHITTPSLMCMLTITGSVLLTPSTSHGQGLSQRIDHVRQERMRAEARNTEKAHLLSVLLYHDIEMIEFHEQEARDVIRYLQNLLGVPIIGRWSDDRAGHGIDPHARITLRAENRPALNILEQILQQCADFEETTWQLRDGFIEIGTKERLAARSAQEIRYYPIRDLLFEPPTFDNNPQFDLQQALQQDGGGGGGGGGGGFGGGGGGSGGGGGGGGLFGAPGADPERMTEEERAEEIINLIVEMVETEGWDQMGGTWATIRFYQGTLIVNAPDFIHRQLAGYPYRTAPISAVRIPGRRVVTFTGGMSRLEIIEQIRPNIGTTAAEKDRQDGNKTDR